MAISEQLLDGINTLQIGNSRGFDVIYNETYSYVYARARMIMKDEQDTNDLVQDTYIQAYQNINSLQDPQNIFAWLGGIAYRQGMKIYRKKNDVLLDVSNSSAISVSFIPSKSWILGNVTRIPRHELPQTLDFSDFLPLFT